MSGELSDDDPQKWQYSEHARAKHAIQFTYLGAWLAILGTHFSPLRLFDGFAGRGHYEGGEEGSPLLFWRRAREAVERGRPQQVDIHCVELSKTNFADLQEAIANLSHPGLSITAENGEFAACARAAVSTLGESTPPPVFWTADPYGFRGVPLEVIAELMALPRSEVLITFMVRDMRRFLGEDNFDAPLNEFFGGESWRECIEHSSAEEREQCLLLVYSGLIRNGVARFATPFKVFEDERRQTLYYLIHLTNHPLGMRQMKKAMIRESPDMTFWPVTTRPPDQLALDTAEQSPYPSLQRHLKETYMGQSITFEDLLNQDYPVGLWLEPEYRAAVSDLVKREEVEIDRRRNTPSGQEPRGVQLPDLLRFGAQLQLG